MKLKSVALIGVGVIAGLLLAPKSGKDSYQELKKKLNELYLEAKELDIDDVKDKIEDIKIEMSKLDYDKSKDIITQSLEKVKDKLILLVDELQDNQNIKPALERAFSSTEKAAIEVIDYIDEKELIERTREAAYRVKQKSGEYFEAAKDKASDIVDKGIKEEKKSTSSKAKDETKED